MSRVLTAARAVVAADQRTVYLDLIGRLASRLEARGQHCWLFERRGAPGEFLEFAEGKDEASHRHRGPFDAAEAALEAELQRVARYDADRDQVWEAVTLAPREA